MNLIAFNINIHNITEISLSFINTCDTQIKALIKILCGQKPISHPKYRYRFVHILLSNHRKFMSVFVRINTHTQVQKKISNSYLELECYEKRSCDINESKLYGCIEKFTNQVISESNYIDLIINHRR